MRFNNFNQGCRDCRVSERGGALLAALMMLVVVSLIGVAIASSTIGAANDIHQHVKTSDEYWDAYSAEQTTEASVRTDLPTAYDLEMRLARSISVGSELPAFDPRGLSAANTRPLYDPQRWELSFRADGLLSVSGQRTSIAPADATSLLGQVAPWLEAHRSLPITYAFSRGYNPSNLSLTLGEAYRLAVPGAIGPLVAVQFAIDSRAGVGGRVRETGLINLGPPLAGAPNPCANSTIAVDASASPVSVASGESSTLSISFMGSNHLTVTAQGQSGSASVLYDQPVTEQAGQQQISVATGPILETTTFTVVATGLCGSKDYQITVAVGGGSGPPPPVPRQYWCQDDVSQAVRLGSDGRSGYTFIEGYVILKYVGRSCGRPVTEVRFLSSPAPRIELTANGQFASVLLRTASVDIDRGTGQISIMVTTDRTWIDPVTFGSSLSLSGRIELVTDDGCRDYYDFVSFPSSGPGCRRP
jgi:hypothetical protein